MPVRTDSHTPTISADQAVHGDPTPGTLGAVLYANKARAPLLETDWVDLVRRIDAGDQLALHALYARAHRPVFTLIMRITSNRQTAEELTLDVFHDVWRRAGRYEPEGGTVLGWIMNQARSRAIDRLRFEGRQKRVNPGGDDWRQPTAPRDSHDAVVLREQSRVLQKALVVLTPDERHAIETAYFNELTYAEVAEKLRVPLGTIKTRIRSGLAKLRQALADGLTVP
jgi:RNA polymerase sigma-70 factor, ECF subfamily